MVSLCVVGDVRKRRNVNGKESHPNQNGTCVYMYRFCAIIIHSDNFPSDDDRITSSETTSQSQIALSKCVALHSA